MRKSVRKLALSRESLRNLSPIDVAQGAAATRPSINIGCTTEYTWYCPSRSACSACPICPGD